jgi:hypothetical protein
LETPEAKRRGKIFRNWLAHGKLEVAVQSAMCPICRAGPENLVWKCHDLTIEDTMGKATEAFENSMPKGNGKGKKKALNNFKIQMSETEGKNTSCRG